MKQQNTISKVLRLAESTAANEIEPVIYADFQVSRDSIDLIETRYAVIIRGVEIDISSDVRYELNRVCNRTKREQFLSIITDELTNDEVFAALENEETLELND